MLSCDTEGEGLLLVEGNQSEGGLSRGLCQPELSDEEGPQDSSGRGEAGHGLLPRHGRRSHQRDLLG